MKKFLENYPYIIVIKGISGTGKSTRVFHLIQFLKSIGVEFVPYKYCNINNKEVEVGLYSKEFNLLFVGNLYNKNGFNFWQGYDAKTGSLVGSKGMTEFLKDLVKKGVNVLVEGAGITGTNRLRPMFLCSEVGFLNIFMIRYDYVDGARKDYDDRIYYRSGKITNTNQMWSKLGGFANDINKSRNEAIVVNNAGGCVYVEDLPYDAPRYDLGIRFFDIVGLSCINSDFIKFSKTVPDNKFAQ
jgi:hypothetical protein